MNRCGAIIPVVGFKLVKNSVITIQCELKGHKMKAERRTGGKVEEGDSGTGGGKQKECEVLKPQGKA